MAPLPYNGAIATLIIGFAFGFVLERAGFGNARNLAAQFYLHDMRVFKVMFTAILVAMVLVFAGSALGILDFAKVWVPPTRLGPAIVGGLLLGFGFILGGYCPGTSIVSSATFKIDGMFFVVGVVLGIFGFSFAVPHFETFWNSAGEMGRVTWDQVLKIDAGYVVLAIVVMAIIAFLMAEFVERLMATRGNVTETELANSPVSQPKFRFRRGVVITGLAIAALAIYFGQPTVARNMETQKEVLEKTLQSRTKHIDPSELLGLMHNNQISLRMYDVRSEADYNLFHLVDAKHVTLKDLEGDLPNDIDVKDIVVVMSNDEHQAEEAWKRLEVRPNINEYILAGGINRWLDIYRDKKYDAPGPEVAAKGDDTLRHTFAKPLGQRYPEAKPPADSSPERKFPKKVKVIGPVRAPGGGCG